MCTGVVPMMPCCVVWVTSGCGWSFSTLGGSRNSIRNRGPSETTILWLYWTEVCLGQTPQYQNSMLALMMWPQSLWQSRKHLQCPAVVQGFSERGALFGLRLQWDGRLGHRTDCQAMKTHHMEERRIWKHHAIHVFVRSTHTHPKLDGCVVWVVIFYWAWPGYYKQQETKYPQSLPSRSSSTCPSLPKVYNATNINKKYKTIGDLFIGNASRGRKKNVMGGPFQ